MFPASDVTTKKRPDTAVTQFKNSLNQLMVILMNKEPSYIRCIKPNDEQSSGMYKKYVISNRKQKTSVCDLRSSCSGDSDCDRQ